MEHQVHYNNLIETRRSRIPDPNVRYEKHHVVMKSMGGTNDKENLVYLTSREHFIAHRLLWLIYRNSKTAWAFRMMCMRNKTWSSKIYEELRQNLFHSEETKRKQSISGKNKPAITEETRIKMSNGQKISIDCLNKFKIGHKSTIKNGTVAKMSKSHTGLIASESHCKNISNSLKGRKKTKAHIDKICKQRRDELFLKKENILDVLRINSGVIKKSCIEIKLRPNQFYIWLKEDSSFKEEFEFIKKSFKNPRIGTKLEQTECPHCNKFANISNLKRWHLDNRKLKYGKNKQRI